MGNTGIACCNKVAEPGATYSNAGSPISKKESGLDFEIHVPPADEFQSEAAMEADHSEDAVDKTMISLHDMKGMKGMEPATEEKENMSPQTCNKPGFHVVFDSESGEEHSVWVQHKPLGLTFNKGLPIIITGFKPDSYGEHLGIKLGWVLKSMNGQDISSQNSFEEGTELMARQMDVLPTYSPTK